MGGDDYVDYGNILNPNMADFSISLWMKTIDTVGNVIGKDSGSGAGYRFDIASGWNGNCIFWFQDAARSGSAYVYAGYVATDGDWHNIVSVLNRTQKTIKSYSDGILWNTRALDPGFLDGAITNTASLTVGSTSFTGFLDDVRIYNRALSTAEISAIYNATK